MVKHKVLFLINAILFLLAAAAWFICVALGKMEWYSAITATLYLIAGVLNLIIYIRILNKSKDMGETNG